MAQFKFVAVLILFLLVLIVGLQNNDPVELKFLFWGGTINRLVLFPGLFLFGVVMGMILRIGVRRPSGIKQ